MAYHRAFIGLALAYGNWGRLIIYCKSSDNIFCLSPIRSCYSQSSRRVSMTFSTSPASAAPAYLSQSPNSTFLFTSHSIYVALGRPFCSRLSALSHSMQSFVGHQFTVTISRQVETSHGLLLVWIASSMSLQAVGGRTRRPNTGSMQALASCNIY